MNNMFMHFVRVSMFTAVLATLGNAAIVELDSDSFDWKYEMEQLPNMEDQDSNGQPDFLISENTGGTSAVTDGVLTIYSPGSSGGSYLFMSYVEGTVWPGKMSVAEGYTIEARVKVVQTEDEGSRGPFGVGASPSGTVDYGFLAVQSGGQSWTAAASAGSMGLNDNTDDYHTFRVAADVENGVYNVWRDGVLVGDKLGPQIGGSDLDRMYFGDPGGAFSGEVAIDYFRFTEGVYAPVGGEQPVEKPAKPGPVTGGPVVEDGTTPYAWYRSDEGVVTYQNESNRVAWWSDQSGNDRHIEGFGTPTLTSGGVDGKAVLAFDGGDCLQSTVEDWGQATPGTVFAVWSRAETSDTSSHFVYDSVVHPRQFFSVHQESDPPNIETGGSIALGDQHYTSDGALQDSVGTENWALSSVTHTTGSTDTVRINGEEVFVGDLISAGMGGLTIGSARSGASAFWNGYIAELIVFEGVLSSSEVESIEGALMSRWGISSNFLEGDLNGDGFVGGDDLDIVRSFWGQSVETGNLLQGDPSEDGFVGGDDLDIVRANWGQGSPPSPSSIPEPMSIALLCSGMLAWLCRPRAI